MGSAAWGRRLRTDRMGFAALISLRLGVARRVCRAGLARAFDELLHIDCESFRGQHERLVLSAPIKSGRKRWGVGRTLRGVGSFAVRSAIGSAIESIATRRLLLRDRRVRLRLPHVGQVAC